MLFPLHGFSHLHIEAFGRNSRRMKNYNRPFILMISILLIVIGIMTAWYMITHAIPNQPFEAARRLPR